VSQAAIREFQKRNNNHAPLQLFYYRDGVSDSEFETVYQQEYQAIAGMVSSILIIIFFKLRRSLQMLIIKLDSHSSSVCSCLLQRGNEYSA